MLTCINQQYLFQLNQFLQLKLALFRITILFSGVSSLPPSFEVHLGSKITCLFCLTEGLLVSILSSRSLPASDAVWPLLSCPQHLAGSHCYSLQLKKHLVSSVMAPAAGHVPGPDGILLSAPSGGSFQVPSWDFPPQPLGISPLIPRVRFTPQPLEKLVHMAQLCVFHSLLQVYSKPRYPLLSNPGSLRNSRDCCLPPC